MTKIYIIGEAGKIFYGNKEHLEDHFLFNEDDYPEAVNFPADCTDDDIKAFFANYPEFGELVITEGELISRGFKDGSFPELTEMSYEDGTKAIIDQIAAAEISKDITNCPHCGSDELVDFGEKSSECQTCGKTFLIKPREK